MGNSQQNWGLKFRVIDRCALSFVGAPIATLFSFSNQQRALLFLLLMLSQINGKVESLSSLSVGSRVGQPPILSSAWLIVPFQWHHIRYSMHARPQIAD